MREGERDRKRVSRAARDDVILGCLPPAARQRRRRWRRRCRR